MLRSFRVFRKDYKDLLRHTKKFYSRHWGGAIVANFVVLVVGLALLGAPERISNLKERWEEKKEDSSKNE